MSLETDQTSDDWWVAYVVPVYKRGDKCSAENYRPVSIGSICSKVMKHILFSNIMQHLDKNFILMDAQHRFCKKHSCETN